MTWDIKTTIQPGSLMDAAQHLLAEATEQASTQAVQLQAMEQESTTAHDRLSSLEALPVDLTKADQPRELEIASLRRGLATLDGRITTARTDADRLDRKQKAAASAVHELGARLFKAEHDYLIVSDIEHPEVQIMTVAELRHQQVVQYSEIQRIAGRPASKQPDRAGSVAASA